MTSDGLPERDGRYHCPACGQAEAQRWGEEGQAPQRVYYACGSDELRTRPGRYRFLQSARCKVITARLPKTTT
jgi:hypothetical protein